MQQRSWLNFDVGKAITEALQADKHLDLVMWTHGPWVRSTHRMFWPCLRCMRCGLKSLSGIPETDNPWLPRWCNRRSARSVRHLLGS